MSDLCSLTEGGGGGGGGGGGAASFLYADSIFLEGKSGDNIKSCAAPHYLVFNDPIYGQHLGYVLTHSPVHYAHHPVEFP